MTCKQAHFNRRRRINGFAGVQYLLMGEMFCRRFAFGGHTDRQDGGFGRTFVMLNDRIRDAPILECCFERTKSNHTTAGEWRRRFLKIGSSACMTNCVPASLDRSTMSVSRC
jgi:hypothetical protein